MKVELLACETTQAADPADLVTLVEHDDVVVVEVNFNRPKRPSVWISDEIIGDSIKVSIALVPSENTPRGHHEDRIRLDFAVTNTDHLVVIDSSGRYYVHLVFIDRKRCPNE